MQGEEWMGEGVKRTGGLAIVVGTRDDRGLSWAGQRLRHLRGQLARVGPQPRPPDGPKESFAQLMRRWCVGQREVTGRTRKGSPGESVQNTALKLESTAPQGPCTLVSPKEIFIVTCNFHCKQNKKNQQKHSVDHLDDNVLIEFSHSISERAFAFFIDHPAGSERCFLCSGQKRTERIQCIHSHEMTNSCQVKRKRRGTGALLGTWVSCPSRTCTQVQSTTGMFKEDFISGKCIHQIHRMCLTVSSEL